MKVKEEELKREKKRERIRPGEMRFFFHDWIRRLELND